MDAQDIDHRKKRRNRTTHSCINCHTTKRKCDRKRPCQRCTQLGITGLCVYEVDDPTLPDDPNVDEATRLRKRIAELEGVIRELKNKPHPRWISQAGPAGDSFHTRAQQQQHKKRKLDDSSSSSFPPPVKLEHDQAAFDYDDRFALPENFQLGPPSDDSYHSGSPGHHSCSSHGGSPPISPSSCECLTNATAFHQLTALEPHLRSALASLQHNETPVDRCSIYAEIARLQELILASTRAETPMMMTRVPLTVTVPTMAFPDGSSFTLRPPPQGSNSNSSLASPVHDKQLPHGIITPPLSSHGQQDYPWATHPQHTHSPSPPIPAQAHASPALSSASTFSGSHSSHHSGHHPTMVATLDPFPTYGPGYSNARYQSADYEFGAQGGGMLESAYQPQYAGMIRTGAGAF